MSQRNDANKKLGFVNNIFFAYKSFSNSFLSQSQNINNERIVLITRIMRRMIIIIVVIKIRIRIIMTMRITTILIIPIITINNNDK